MEVPLRLVPEMKSTLAFGTGGLRVRDLRAAGVLDAGLGHVVFAGHGRDAREQSLDRRADGPSLRLWYAAFGKESGDSVQFGEITPIPPNYSIGYAAAPLTAPG